MRRLFGGLWRSPDFVRLWAGQTISLFGSHIGGGALRYAAILALGATPIQFALLTAAELAPALLLALPAGVWVDRVRRRPVLIAADVGRALLLLSIPAAFLLGALRIEHLYLVAALSSALTILFDTAYPSYVPSVVRRDELVEANSKLGASDSLAEIAGPPLGGVLVQLVSAPLAVALDALSFLASALALRGVRAEEAPPRSATAGTERTEMKAPDSPAVPPAASAAQSSPRANVRRELGEGLAAVRGRPELAALLGVAVTQSLAGGIIGTLYDLYLIRELGLSPALVGLTVGVGGVGALAGAFLAGPAVRRLGLRRTLLATYIVGWVTSFALPLARGPLAVWLIAAMQLFDVVGAIFAITALSVRQRATPDRLLGRVNASFNMLTIAAGLVGALAGGALGQAVGMRAALGISVALGTTGVVWLLGLREEATSGARSAGRGAREAQDDERGARGERAAS